MIIGIRNSQCSEPVFRIANSNCGIPPARPLRNDRAGNRIARNPKLRRASVKLLIANRGEIAVRIIRACREMDIETVAVYSEVDRLSPHVLMADQSFPIGPAEAAKSYLNMDNLLEVAVQSGAGLLHPGTDSWPKTPTSPRRSRRPVSPGSGHRPRRCGSWARRPNRASLQWRPECL